ncbi:MAG TPA: DUF3108 domain-containing protein [Steroidobacteraceae bacterium]|jgi:hypothetical protein|nr:DUF3108 domain-containing protein [Steroidobacteraceae bacterium]
MSSAGSCWQLASLISLVSLALSAPALRAQDLAPPPASPATAQLQPFQASYLWYWHGTPIAFSRMNLVHRADDLWVYSSTTRPRGIGRLYPMRPDLQSLMRITPEHVLPMHFKVTGSGRGHDSDVSFDWQSLRATGLYEGAHIDEPVHPGDQDDLSVQIAMLTKLLAGQTPDRVMEIDKDGVREYDYEREGEEQLDTALGRIDTTVYASHHPGSPRTTRFWCAPSLGYIPLQVQQRRDNSVEWTMKIRSLAHAP